ncbi:MAG: two-component system sensor histidine kinase/response regulator [Planctomycetota bacterium]|jgi:two-component system sensor histidine kinase/response regulator
MAEPNPDPDPTIDAPSLARRLVELEDRIDGETALRAELVDGLLAARGPLDALLDIANRVLTDQELGEANVELTDGLVTLARRMDELLDLESFGLFEQKGGSEAFDPRRLIEECLTGLGMHAGERGIELVAELDPALPERLEGDARGLREVIRRLVGRAFRRATNGEILVQLKRCGDEGARAHLTLTITDSGISIDPVEAEVLMRDENRRGLARCVRYARAAGGEFAIRAGATGGTEAEMELYFDCLATSAESGGNPALLVGTRILVVDDNQSARESATRLLEGFGCRATCVDGVGYALAEMNLASQEGDPFRMCLVDLRMPAKGGFQLAEQLREGTKSGETKLVLMYANCREGDLLEARRRGFAAEVSKPLRVGQLRSTIERLLPEQNASLPSPRHLRILLAEDNPLHSRIARGTLERDDHEVCTARTGKEVLEILESESIDLILMDRQMPELDGLYTTRAIRARSEWMNLPIIGMTSSALGNEREDCVQAGMNDLMVKPLRMDAVRELIARWCA